MRGLARLPSTYDLQQAYDELQSARGLIATDRLVLYSQWSRLDPRLAEIMVGHLGQYWQSLSLGSLLEALQQQPWPRAFMVLLRFVELELKAPDRLRRKALRAISEAVNECFPEPVGPRAPELFFIPLRVPNPVVLRGEVEGRSRPYTQAGFIGSQSLLSHARPPKGRTLLSPERRKRLIEALFERHRVVRVEDVVNACQGMVSRRQAQRDLEAFEGATARGFTRARVYLKRGA